MDLSWRLTCSPRAHIGGGGRGGVACRLSGSYCPHWMLGLGLFARLAVLESLDSAIVLASLREHGFDFAGFGSSIRRAKPQPKGPAPRP